ncbi:hypothetical protein ABIC09_002523 [Bradyrhizobium sp. S3.12.5]
MSCSISADNRVHSNNGRFIKLIGRRFPRCDLLRFSRRQCAEHGACWRHWKTDENRSQDSEATIDQENNKAASVSAGVLATAPVTSYRFHLDLARHNVNQKSFEPDKSEDEYETALIDLIDRKRRPIPFRQPIPPTSPKHAIGNRVTRHHFQERF